MPLDGYASKQATRDAAYSEAYVAWVASLSPAERERLHALNLDSPLMAHTKASGKHDHDMADDPHASEWPDMPGAVDERAGYFEPDHGTTPPPDAAYDFLSESLALGAGATPPSYPAAAVAEAMADRLRQLVAYLITSENTKLAVQCLAVVSGVQFLGDSMSDLAKSHGVSRAAVSKRCVDLSKIIGLPPSRAMRSEASRAVSAAARRKAAARAEGLALS